jgi:hypothetical protein
MILQDIITFGLIAEIVEGHTMVIRSVRLRDRAIAIATSSKKLTPLSLPTT